MGERIVSIKLRADATGAIQGFSQVGEAATGLKAKLSESARSNREEWATVGKSLTAVGVAITGIGVAALKTGIEYNTLQQTTRAALTTLLGSARAANAQMDKLDAFARNSPFSKATFITAQQQMLAFGIETKKVIPYLDAVQNAVAAAGGNNQQIAELSFIMAQISAAGKITAQDLMQFGQRGVNAADLIGSQMGKTGVQIREQITKGTLGADEALDALAAGMAQTYAGAAANVKNTFEGAMDRVKAAWRDFSAELAKPLVDPNGGGALVDLLNWAADAMRNFENLPDPIKNTASAVAGLTGAGTLAVGMAMLLIPKWLEFSDALKKLGVNADSTKAAIGSIGPAALAVGLALASAHLADAISDFREATVASNELAKSLRKTGDVTAELTKGFSSSNPFSGLTDGSAMAETNLRQLNTGIGQMRATWESSPFGKAMSLPFLGFGRDLGQAKEQIEEFDSALASLVASGKTEAATDGYKQFAAMARNAGWEQKSITDALPEYAAAQEEAALATQEASENASSIAEQYQEASARATELTDQLLSLLDAFNEMNGVGQTAEQTNSTLQTSFAKLQEYVANAQAGTEGYSLSLDANTAAGAANRSMLASYAADVEKNAQAQFELESKTLGATAAAANFESRLSAGRQQIYDTALALTGSADEAQKLTDKILAMPSSKDISVLLRGAAEAETELNNLARYRETTIGIRYEGEKGTHVRAYGGTIGLAGGGTVAGMGGGIANGTVFGRGGTKSDSVLVRLSRGEEVIQEPYASMYRRELKQMNRGDFVASQQPIILQMAPAPSEPTSVVQQNMITMVERDPRLLARQFGRELKAALS